MYLILNIIKKLWLIVVVVHSIMSCSSVKKFAVDRDVNSILSNSELFSKHFTGFSLFDLESNEYIADYNSTLLFTPASNTKLLTMYVALKSFNDSIPGLIFSKVDNRTIVRPIGDPSFLYYKFKNQPVYDFLSAQNEVVISLPENQLSPFGAGWAWDDYSYDYQPQRCWWPIYGNAITIKKEEKQLKITPSFFADFVDVYNEPTEGSVVNREVKFNLFKAYVKNDTSAFEESVPFEYSDELLIQLLNDTLKIKVSLDSELIVSPDTLFSQQLDTVLAAMMKPSDNFLAEQLLIQAAWQNGYTEIKPFIKHVKTVWLPDLNDMVWVDGSGLSRYNLITPVDQVRLLKKCFDEFGWDRITKLLATGGEGTLEELYISESSYIFAKTGTLSNNHNLSGFLITKSGKRLIFSLMNNHYITPTGDIKKAVQDFLINIRDAY